MSNDDLTFVQRCTLITLMVENREMPNAELTNARLYLKTDQRDALKRKGLIVVNQVRKGRPVSIALTGKGRARAADEFGLDAPERAGAGGAALYRVLAGLKIYFDRVGLDPVAVFAGTGAPRVEHPPAVADAVATDDLETLIRKAYGAVAKRSGDFVMLSRLRPRLGAVPRADVDAALKRLNRAPDVSLVPESNQKGLTEDDRAAAVTIGNQDRHLISIGL